MSIIPFIHRSPSQSILALARRDGWTALYDVTNPATRTVESGYVSSVDDALGNLPPLLQATGSKQPAYLPGEYGQLAGMDGTSEARFLQTTTFAAALAQPNCLLVVARSATTSQASRMLVDGGTSSTRHAILMCNATGNPFGLYAGTEQATVASDTDAHIHLVFFDGSSTQVWLDGVWGRPPASPGTHTLNGLTLGERYASNGGQWNGSYGLLLVRDTLPTRRQRVDMTRLISGLSGISLPEFDIDASGGASYDSTGKQLWGKAASTVQYPASLTKLMTVYTMRQWIADGDLSDTVTLVESDIVGGSGLELAAGDILSYGELLYGALLPSCNKCATAIARAVGQVILDAEEGSGDPTTRFLTEMAANATAFGWTGAVFADACGVYINSRLSPDQVCELLLAINDDATLVTVMGTASHDVVVSGGPNPRSVTATHTVDPTGATKLPAFVAGKTGSGETFHVAALWDDEDGERHATAVIGSSTAGQRFKDLRQVMEEVMDRKAVGELP